MSTKTTFSLHTLPVEMVYRILDHLSEKTIILSVYNVCQRLNTIVDSYHRYQVKLDPLPFFLRTMVVLAHREFIILVAYFFLA